MKHLDMFTNIITPIYEDKFQNLFSFCPLFTQLVSTYRVKKKIAFKTIAKKDGS
jgi:hypothetical protein